MSSFPLVVPCITLRQPFASLVVARVKRYDTRPKPYPDYVCDPCDGPWEMITLVRVCICAAEHPHSLAELPEPTRLFLLGKYGEEWLSSLPLGALVGTVVARPPVPTDTRKHTVQPTDLLLSDWSDGRWAMRFDRPYKFRIPVPTNSRHPWFFYVDYNTLPVSG